MYKWMILLPVLLPIAAGAIIPLLHFKEPGKRQAWVLTTVILASLMVLLLMFRQPEGSLTCIRITQRVPIAFRIDSLSMVFGGILAALWPLAVLYAFEYMRHEGGENRFFTWYTMCYGVTLGIAFSANLVTMYLFYELLTLVTLPIIMHKGDLKAVNAGRKYLLFSVTGAAFALMGIMILYHITGTVDFVYGGQLVQARRDLSPYQGLIEFGYLLTFFGFGVKAAVWPMHGWLPTAGVAPTPVTALLHAVAVVKAGVFAIMRATWYGYGIQMLRGTKVQYITMAFACFTILYGSCMAVKEPHLKRRLAYSTVSNLSYIVFGITLMTPYGFGAALTHMVFHAVMKIGLFFAVGAVLTQTGYEYVWQIHGLGRRMRFTFGCFTVCSMAVIGVPGFCGFLSKWHLCEAAIISMNRLAITGIIALIISAIFTSVYLFTVIIPAFFYPEAEESESGGHGQAEDPGMYMKVPLLILSAAVIILGLFSQPLIQFLMQTGAGF